MCDQYGYDSAPKKKRITFVKILKAIWWLIKLPFKILKSIFIFIKKLDNDFQMSIFRSWNPEGYRKIMEGREKRQDVLAELERDVYVSEQSQGKYPKYLKCKNCRKSWKIYCPSDEREYCCSECKVNFLIDKNEGNYLIHLPNGDCLHVRLIPNDTDEILFSSVSQSDDYLIKICQGEYAFKLEQKHLFRYHHKHEIMDHAFAQYLDYITEYLPADFIDTINNLSDKYQPYAIQVYSDYVRMRKFRRNPVLST